MKRNFDLMQQIFVCFVCITLVCAASICLAQKNCPTDCATTSCQNAAVGKCGEKSCKTDEGCKCKCALQGGGACDCENS